LIICDFDIELHRLKKEDLELVRHWRNHESVRTQMLYQSFINMSDQIKWFSNIDQMRDYYFIIHQNIMPVGCINIKDVDNIAGTGEAGIFMNPNHKGKDRECAIKASVTLIKWAFTKLGLKQIRAKIKSTNRKASQLNQLLGYMDVLSTHDTNIIHYKLTRDKFDESLKKLEEYLDYKIFQQG